MKSRVSSHFFILIMIVGLTAIAHYSIHYGALIRGYETSWLIAGRNLVLLVILAVLPVFFAKLTGYKGNWTLYTSAVLLFSIGLTAQFRLFSDPEYTSREDKAKARQEKIRTIQRHYIQENYSAEKKRMMGLEAIAPSPIDLSSEIPKPSEVTLGDVLFSDKTLIPLFAIFCLFITFLVTRNERALELMQKNGFLIVLLTLGPLLLAVFTSAWRKIDWEYDSVGAFEDSFPDWLCCGFIGSLQKPGSHLLGYSAS